MAATLLSPGDPRRPPYMIEDTGADVVARQRLEHMAKVDPKPEFVTAQVAIDFGPKKTKEELTLRWEVNSTFAFAVYRDNAAWQDRGREEWTAAATDALEKFAAVRDLQIVAGPRPEITNRYNLFIETRERIAA